MINFKAQNISDFEERIHTAKREITIILSGERTTEPETNLQSATYICGRCQSAGAAHQTTEPVGRKERAQFNAKVKEEEEKSLRSWAKEMTLWVSEDDFSKQYKSDYIAEGAEQKVFLKKDGKTVIRSIQVTFMQPGWTSSIGSLCTKHFSLKFNIH